MFDITISAFAGTVLGIFFTFILMVLLGGTNGGIWLDIFIAAAVTASGVVAHIVLKGRSKAFVLGACIAVAIMSTFGTFQMSNILTHAEVLAAGRKWCLATADDVTITSVDQLGYFSLNKGGQHSPHLTLNIEGLELHEALNWSIRRQKFDPSYFAFNRCEPLKYFAENIR
ncbi:hypothetical protein [Roseibium sp. TrichSKD4]|uniref:hypothetical protein n=1 Tax=Roseibium sp. TrichSKD4 TaxID=744980 RepID=UPI001111C21A|nr:hypothetical protein [Roseibium sp. TrichSKD4]